MNLEEPERCTVESLQESQTATSGRMNFTFPRCLKELGMCSALLSMLSFIGLCKRKSECIIHWFCALHTRSNLRLEIRSNPEFNSQCQDNVKTTYHLFKKASLRWRLFKQQARCIETHYLRYKRPPGTHWPEHQYNSNLPLLIGYCNNQIADPTTTQWNKQHLNSKQFLEISRKLATFSSMLSSKTSW